MTDHRSTDLSFGHLGEPSYDTDQKQWVFSISPSKGQTFQQLLSFKLCQRPCLQNALQAKTKSSSLARSHIKALVKSKPELFPAYKIATTMSQDSSPRQDLAIANGQLLSVGGAVDVEHLPGYRTIPIIAIAHGEAGHVLQLIKPSLERHGWRKHGSVTLPLMNLDSSENGYWTGFGGTIHQIVFADDGNTASTWLAVRQTFVTTVFRPMYNTTPVPAVTPLGHRAMYPPSRLSANPVAVLTTEQTGSVHHVDISFNPYYTRQFAVVDDVGSWSIWNIEGRTRNRSTLELIPGNSGRIFDDYVPDLNLKEPQHADGWHRLMWVSNVSTLVICNRRHIAVFDVKSTPKRLRGNELFPIGSTDWILDMKRGILNLNHLFILTSSRIFWVEIIPAGEEYKDGDCGTRMLLSYRHFRDPSDETMKLTILKDDDISITISSDRSCLVNFYSFSTGIDNIGGSTSSRGSFTLSLTPENQAWMAHEALQSINFFQTLPIPSLSRLPGPEVIYIDQNVRFYQLFTFSPSAGLRMTLCSVRTDSSELLITAPNYKSSFAKYRNNRKYGRVVDTQFITSDGALDEELLASRGSDCLYLHHVPVEFVVQDDKRFRMNWSPIFQQLFIENSGRLAQQMDSSVPINTMTELLDNVSNYIKRAKEANNIAACSFFELCQNQIVSEELDQTGLALNNFIESIQINEDFDSPGTLILTNLTSCPGIDFAVRSDDSLPNLLQVYDQVARKWMACLPPKVSNLSRLSKFKIALRVAVELCLSSIGIYSRNEAAQEPNTPTPEMSDISLPILTKVYDQPRETSPRLPSSQLTQTVTLSQDAGFNQTTSSKTEYLYSHGLNATAESIEDPAIRRLRQYVGSIKPPPEIGKSPLLSLWPAFPGTDPGDFKWEGLQDDLDEFDDHEENLRRRRREEDHHHKRTKRFLERVSATSAQHLSQPASPSTGSQPYFSHHASSSQMVEEQPMTQPHRGIFGSRAQLGVKKQKKRRAAGF